MTAVTISDRAGDLRPGRALLTVVAAPFFVLGLAVGLLIAGVLILCAAVAEGFDTGRGVVGDRQ